MKDPLGLSYFRRLSLTEQLGQAFPPMTATYEVPEVAQRRQKAAGLLGGIPDYPRIPLAPEEFAPYSGQYLVPRPDISRYLLPSYANHILETESTPKRKAVSVKMYRLEHTITQPYQFSKLNMNPHHPTTYRPYYLGEFGVNPATGKVELLDPQDPLLYWLVPILPKIAPPDDPEGGLHRLHVRTCPLQVRLEGSAAMTRPPLGKRWLGFWFAKADPTTLGFMRVVTGLLIIYIHLAYSFDLQSFFGESGWYRLEDVNAERTQYPWTMVSFWKWDDEFVIPGYIPEYAHRRKGVVEWYRKLADLPKDQRMAAVAYLDRLVKIPSITAARDGLQFAERIPQNDLVRKNRLDMITDPKPAHDHRSDPAVLRVHEAGRSQGDA